MSVPMTLTESTPKPEVPAYVKYNETGIVALICAKCATTREKETIGAVPEGLEPIPLKDVVICSRCGEIA
jgi:hypothetical protein